MEKINFTLWSVLNHFLQKHELQDFFRNMSFRKLGTHNHEANSSLSQTGHAHTQAGRIRHGGGQYHPVAVNSSALESSIHALAKYFRVRP